MAPSQIHWPAEQTFAVHQEVESYPEDEGELEDMFAVCDHPPWNNRRPPEPSTTRSNHPDTCRSDLRVGNSSPIIVNKGMAIINRETLHRPGPHPHWSVFTSSRPHVIIMHQPKFIPLTAGYFIQSYSTTSEFRYGNMFVNCVSGSCRTTGDTCKRCYRENTVDSDSSSEYFITSRQHRTGDTPGRPVSELVTIGGQPSWGRSRHADFGSRPLEGWIGDYAVDFLVDSGSAVTAVSTSFYKNLREVGAPVGEIRATNRRLRGANGSRIDILGMPLYRDVCSPWDIVRFHRIQKQFFIVPLALWVAGRCRQVDCWKVWLSSQRIPAW